MSERIFNLVVPLGHEPTAMRTTGTTGSPARPGAVSPLSDRRGDVNRTNGSTPPTLGTPGIRTSTTATRTTTTRTTSLERARSADGNDDFTFEELARAYFDCRRTKRNSAAALAFERNLEANLLELHDELAGGTYRPGRSICFVVTRPKPREVWAAEFRDRVVHWLLYNHVAPRFHAAFIADTCACIPGRGTLYAAVRLEAKIRSITENWSKPAFYLKLDLANFFVSIDKRILADQLERRIPEPWWLALAKLILFHDPRQGVQLQSTAALMARVPPYKSLLNQPAHLGLPIGNLSSQFFANVYLDALDQHAKHEIHARHYIRYVDDFLFLHESPQWLNQARAELEAWLPRELHVRLNPRKTILQPVERGVDFVGHVLKPWRRSIRRRTVNAALSRVASMPAAELYESANSYFGLLRQSPASHGERARLANIVRQRGLAVDHRLTKAYR